MDKVCAVVDAQGFILRGEFYAREAAVASEGWTNCQEFNPGFKWTDLNRKEIGTVKFCMRKIHGLYLHPYPNNKYSPVPNSNQVGNYFKSYYNLIATKEKPLFAVKNERVKNILAHNEIPFLDLNEVQYQFPSINTLERMYSNLKTCAYHLKPRFKNHVFRCAYRKCIHMWSYIKASHALNEENKVVTAQTSDWSE